MDAKHFLTSWTIWFGILQVLLGGVGFISGQMNTEAALALVSTGIGTIGFRIKTTQPVTTSTTE